MKHPWQCGLDVRQWQIHSRNSGRQWVSPRKCNTKFVYKTLMSPTSGTKWKLKYGKISWLKIIFFQQTCRTTVPKNWNPYDKRHSLFKYNDSTFKPSFKCLKRLNGKRAEILQKKKKSKIQANCLSMQDNASFKLWQENPALLQVMIRGIPLLCSLFVTWFM